MKTLILMLIIAVLIPSISFAGEKESVFNCWDYILGPIYWVGLQIYYLEQDIRAWLTGADPGFET